jgi:hypothetical protein
MGFPPHHTKCGAADTARRDMLGQAFQVGTTMQYFRCFKARSKATPNRKFVVVSLFSGIGGDLVALERLQIPVRIVLTIEVDPLKRSVLKNFMRRVSKDPDSSFYQCEHRCYSDICERRAAWNSAEGVAALCHELQMQPGWVVASGGSPCDNLPGTSNRGGKEKQTGQSGLMGEKTILFFVMVKVFKHLLDALKAIKNQGDEGAGEDAATESLKVDLATGALETDEGEAFQECKDCKGTEKGLTKCILGQVKLCKCSTALGALEWLTEHIPGMKHTTNSRVVPDTTCHVQGMAL